MTGEQSVTVFRRSAAELPELLLRAGFEPARFGLRSSRALHHRSKWNKQWCSQQSHRGIVEKSLEEPLRKAARHRVSSTLLFVARSNSLLRHRHNILINLLQVLVLSRQPLTCSCGAITRTPVDLPKVTRGNKRRQDGYRLRVDEPVFYTTRENPNVHALCVR